MIQRIVTRLVRIGEVAKFEPPIDEPVLTHVGLTVRVKFRQHIAIVLKNVINTPLKGIFRRVLPVVVRRPAGAGTKFLVAAPRVFFFTLRANPLVHCFQLSYRLPVNIRIVCGLSAS